MIWDKRRKFPSKRRALKDIKSKKKLKFYMMFQTCLDRFIDLDFAEKKYQGRETSQS